MTIQVFIPPSTTSASRDSVTLAIPDLAASQTVLTTVTLPKSCILLSVFSTKKTWLRLYNRQDNAIADQSRLRTVDPSSGSGVMLEIINILDSSLISLSPLVPISNMENTPTNTYYLRVTNDSNTAGISITFNYLITEV